MPNPSTFFSLLRDARLLVCRLVFSAGFVTAALTAQVVNPTPAVLSPNQGSVNDRVALSGDTMAVTGQAAGTFESCVFVFVRGPSGWVEQARLVSPAGPSSNDAFGDSIALERDTLVVGAPHNWTDRSDGSAYVFVRNGTAWTLQARLRIGTSVPGYGGQFGTSVALQGDTILVGAPYFTVQRSGQPSETGAGAAYVYVRTGTIWTEQAALQPDRAINNTMFGTGLAVLGDLAVVSRPNSTQVDGVAVAPAVFVFQRTSGNWARVATLAGSDPSLKFGANVSLDGERLAVAAPYRDYNSQIRSSLHVFRRDGPTGWLQEAVLQPPAPATNYSFAESCSLSGNLLVVTGYRKERPDDPSSTVWNGDVYFYAREAAGWSEVQRLNNTTYRDLALEGTTLATSRRAFGTSPPHPAFVFERVAPPAAGTWGTSDVGAVAATGFVRHDPDGRITVKGSGTDIGGTSDEFRFYYQSLTGDGEIIARMTAMDAIDGEEKGGVMLRESLAPGSPHAFMFATQHFASGVRTRTTLFGATQGPALNGGAQTPWLKLIRAGDTISAYFSANGADWQFRDTVAFPGMARTIFAGLAVTSHRDGTLCNVTFDNVSIRAGVTSPTPRPAPTGVTATAESASTIRVRWTDATSDETGFEIERSTDGTNFAPLRTVAANTNELLDSGLTAAALYYYRVRDVAGPARSLYSAIVSARTHSSTAPPTPGVWQSRDIGAVATAGSSSESGGTITVTASGADIWETADEFHYRYLTFSGDGEFIVRVTGLSPHTHPWAKAGVMVRESLDANSRHAFMCVSAGRGQAFQYRATTGGTTVSVPDGGTGEGPHLRWLKLIRRGSTVEGYYSADGITWIATGGASVALPSTVYLGVAVTSHNDGVNVTATLDNWSAAALASSVPAPTNLRAEPRSTTSIEVYWTAQVSTQTGFELERAVGSGPFARIATLPATQGSYLDSALTPGTSYTYRIRAVRDGSFSSYSNPATAATPASPPAPGTWFSQDIGPGTSGGSSAESGGVVTVRGAGADIWNSSDEFHYRYQPWSGSGEIIVRVTSLQNTHGWAKAGVMFREGLSNLSRHAFMCLSADHGAVFQHRGTTGGTSDTTVPTSGTGFPTWLRLVREGSTFTGYRSANGTDWTLVGSQTIALPDQIYVGLAVTSHVPGVLCTATFDQVSLSAGAAPVPPPAAPAWLRTNAISNSQIDLLWADSSADETGFEIERRLPGQSFAVLARTPANVRQFSDHGLPAGQEISYRVRAFNSGGFSAYSEIQSPRVPTTNGPTAAPTLTATAASSTRVDVNWSVSGTSGGSYYFLLERSTNAIDYDRQWSVSSSTTAIPDSNVAPGTTYYYRVRSVDAGGYSPYSNRVTVTTPSADPPPPGPGSWQSRDIGAVGVGGSTNESTGAVTLAGAGADIWGTVDEFRYRYQPLAGDGELVARVASLAPTHDWAKAGVMFRETLNPDSRHAFMLISARRGAAFQYRTATLGESGSTTPVSGSAPLWLRLVRSGEIFTGYTSTNGTTWDEAGSVRLSGALATMYVGLAVTSHDDSVLCQASFDGVVLTPGGPPPSTPPNPPSNLVATANSATEIKLTWSDNSTNEAGFEIERSTDNVSYARVATAAGREHTVAGLAANTRYYFRVRAVNASGPSAYSNVANATTLAAPAPAWTFGDIGAVGLAGSNTSSGNTITMSASGADIWGSADAFRFVSRTVTGDGVVEARVDSLQDTHVWAKAGVMIREARDANARNVFAFVTPSYQGTVAQARTGTGGETTSQAGPARNAPIWLRLARAGSTFTAAWSADGVAWTTFATFTVPMSATAHFGFALTSHDNARLNTAVFSDPFVQ